MDRPRSAGVASHLFGPFRLSIPQRRLWRADTEVQLGGRAFDILAILVDRAGSVVPQRELIEGAWPGVFVEEANLRVHIATLRKALGEGGAHYIETVPRRGYCFVAPVTVTGAEPAMPVAGSSATAEVISALPSALSRMVGRDEAVEDIAELLRRHRFVTIVGAGGLGKTTVALAVARAMAPAFHGQVVFVDLGMIARGNLVEATVAAACGLEIRSGAVTGDLAAALRERRLLLLIDNCEHVIDAIASLVERLFAQTSALHILATSREAMRVLGENVYLLAPLDSPPLRVPLTAEQAMSWPAVQLFVERAAAQGFRERLTDAEAPIVAEICRRLDGIALAIELAAGRVATHGVAGTGDLLNYRFKLLWQGRRSAVPRHQTMSAIVDWSYGLLNEQDRTVLSRLSILVGTFSLATAQQVASDARIPPMQVAEALTSLADKSLIAVTMAGGAPAYRLLDMTRSYASTKLEESGDLAAVAQRHAAHLLDRLAVGGAAPQGAGPSRLAGEADLIGNLRSALEWSVSPAGDRRLAVALAAASVPLLLRLSLLPECEQWSARGLELLDDGQRGGSFELALSEGLAVATMFTRGNGEVTHAAIERGLELARRLENKEVEFRLLSGLHMFMSRAGEFHRLVEIAERASELAAMLGGHDARITVEWMLGTAHHLSGDQNRAQQHCEAALAHSLATGVRDLDAFGYDQRIRGLITLVRVLSLRGLFDQAAHMAEVVIAEAERKQHPVALCIALIYTATAAIWAEDFAIAEGRVARIIACATENALEPYRAVGTAMQAEIAIGRGRLGEGIAELREALAILEAERHRVMISNFLRTLAEALAAEGQGNEAIMLLDHTAAQVSARGEGYILSDLLRARGVILMRADPPQPDAAEQAFRAAIALARRQGTPSWELRASRDLARLLLGAGRRVEALSVLQDVLRGFEEGQDRPILRSTRELLDIVIRSAERPA